MSDVKNRAFHWVYTACYNVKIKTIFRDWKYILTCDPFLDKRIKYPLDIVVRKQEVHVQQIQHNMMYCVFDQISTRGHFKLTMHNPST